MGFVTNDPKKSDEQQPGATGLIVDLGLMSCPECRREVPEWQDDPPSLQLSELPLCNRDGGGGDIRGEDGAGTVATITNKTAARMM